MAEDWIQVLKEMRANLSLDSVGYLRLMDKKKKEKPLIFPCLFKSAQGLDNQEISMKHRYQGYKKAPY